MLAEVNLTLVDFAMVDGWLAFHPQVNRVCLAFWLCHLQYVAKLDEHFHHDANSSRTSVSAKRTRRNQPTLDPRLHGIKG